MNRLQDKRKAAGLSQSKKKKKSGVNVRLIQHYEQGTKDINKAQVVTALQLADALGVDVREILNA